MEPNIGELKVFPGHWRMKRAGVVKKIRARDQLPETKCSQTASKFNQAYSKLGSGFIRRAGHVTAPSAQRPGF